MRNLCMIAGLLGLMGPVGGFGEVTHIILVHPNGTFSPQRVEIRDGDTMEWRFSERTDSIIPIHDPAIFGSCQPHKPYDQSDPNEFTGPLPRAASGIFTLGPQENGFVVTNLTQMEIDNLPTNASPTHIGSTYIMPWGEEYATLDETWQSTNLAGVYIRLSWNDVQPDGPGQFDWTAMDREIEQAVSHGKLYNLSFKAGADGTPGWIFDPAVTGSLVVPELRFQDHSGVPDPANCGQWMSLGSPCHPNYQTLYFNLWRAAAERIRSRNAWYRNLAYVKLSGANLHSHENRLPKACDPTCPCNPGIWATNGTPDTVYRPSRLYQYYSNQSAMLATEFPDKDFCYQLIQDGFPKVNELGEYQGQTEPLSDPMNFPIPGNSEQTENILYQGWVEWGTRFVVAHNGLGTDPTYAPPGGPPPRPACPSSGTHPIVPPASPNVGSGCPNWWVLKASERGHVTGFQTENASKSVSNPEELHYTLINGRENSDAVYIEIYENRFWEVDNQSNAMPIAIGEWNDLFHERRTNAYPQLGSPLPMKHQHTFTRTDPSMISTQELYYTHGSKGCSGLPASVGVVAILPNYGVRMLSVSNASPTQLRVEIEGTAGRTNIVEHSTNLETWQHLTTVPNPNGVVEVDVPGTPTEKKFYRAFIEDEGN